MKYLSILSNFFNKYFPREYLGQEAVKPNYLSTGHVAVFRRQEDDLVDFFWPSRQGVPVQSSVSVASFSAKACLSIRRFNELKPESLEMLARTMTANSANLPDIIAELKTLHSHLPKEEQV